MKAVDLCDPNVEPTDEELQELVESMHAMVMERKQKAFAVFYRDLSEQIKNTASKAPGYDEFIAQ
jgi:hypothetical protein